MASRTEETRGRPVFFWGAGPRLGAAALAVQAIRCGPGRFAFPCFGPGRFSFLAGGARRGKRAALEKLRSPQILQNSRGELDRIFRIGMVALAGRGSVIGAIAFGQGCNPNSSVELSGNADALKWSEDRCRKGGFNRDSGAGARLSRWPCSASGGQAPGAASRRKKVSKLKRHFIGGVLRARFCPGRTLPTRLKF